jgi:hypothetical protein
MDENQNHGDPFLKNLYEWFIDVDLDYIRFLGSENKVFQRLRENYQHNWEIVELCREALFDNAKEIAFLRGRIEDERANLKKLG